MKRVTISVILFVFLWSLLPAPASAKEKPLDFQPRMNYGALLEPEGRILHGAGQDPESFKIYSRLPSDPPPAITMPYYNLKNLPKRFSLN